MALIPGTRLGVYEVLAQIGEGGMGQVYRARDTKLNRDVALKVLPDSFANDPDRLARFTREAQTLAALNHPNIAAIYGLEDADDTKALVMELVEGDDLSQRIARGAIPIDEALPIAKQTAEALEAAHEQGIVHRDLKPANIKVRADGTVKVLDFGLAKAMEAPNVMSPSVSQAPTITTPAMMTGVGMILGTAAYMSPEQARGKVVDKRADIWAFGAVLYEMLTGQRAFGGEDVSEVLSRVLQREPEWTTLPSGLSPTLVVYLKRCLHRDLKQRIGDIHDVRLALEGAFDVADPRPTATGARPTSAATRALPWVIAAVAVVVAGALASLGAPWLTEQETDRPLVSLDVDLGADVSLPAPALAGSSVAISSDGTRLVYTSGTPSKLFIRRLDQPRATELPGTLGATAPFFSPDGQWVGFVSAGKAYRTSVEGGAVVPLASGDTVSSASWGDDGSLFVSASQKLLRIPVGGGPPETVTEAGNGELLLYDVQALAGNKAILFAADNPGTVDKTTINVVTLGDRQRKTLIQGGASPRYLATSNGGGHLIYLNGATLFAIEFDLRTLTTRGTAVPVVDDVAHESLVGKGEFDVSRTGTLVYRRAMPGTSALRTLAWVDATGKKEPLQAKPAQYLDLRLSPDGRRVAVTTSGEAGGVSVYDPERDVMARLTSASVGPLYRAPTWTPDGRYVVFSSVGNGIFQARADGGSQPQPLLPTRLAQYPRSFTPDGTRVAFSENRGGGSQLWTVSLTQEGGQLKAGVADPFLKSSVRDGLPAFSPDGRWLAYQSDESGRTEIYVRAFSPGSAPGGKWQISNSGGALPLWSRDGHELVYQSGDQLMSVAYTVTGDTFAAERPRVWIAKLGVATIDTAGPGAAMLGGAYSWDLAPDGKRVAVVTSAESSDAAPRQEHEAVFLQNFFDELRRRVPLGK